MPPDALTIVVALKGGPAAKSRLSCVITAAQRRALWWSMADHVLGVLAALPGPTRRFIVSACPDAALLAARHGAGVIFDARQGGTSAAYEQALDHLGADAPALLLNGDLPCLTADDVAAMTQDATQVAIAPDSRQVGTNALFVPAGTRLPPQFGIDSFTRHIAAAEAAGLSYRIVRSPSLAKDVDEPDDLLTLPDHPFPSPQDARGPQWRTD